MSASKTATDGMTADSNGLKAQFESQYSPDEDPIEHEGIIASCGTSSCNA